jgi:hypothetical protein
MTVRQVYETIVNLARRDSALGPIEVEFGKPWHPNHDRGSKVPNGAAGGLYLYTRPGIGEWRIDAKDNPNDVWYIGKSQKDIGGRVWHHLGSIYEPGVKGVECVPRFKYHKWSRNCDYIAPEIRNAIAEGEVVIYTVALKNSAGFPYLAELVEKVALTEYAFAFNKIPPLNRSF